MFSHVPTRTATLFGGLLLAVALATPSLATAPDPAVIVQVQEDTSARTVLRYEIGEFSTQPVTIKGQEYLQIQLGAESPIKRAGAPELPTINRSIIVADDAAVAVNVLASRYYEITDVDIAPSKGFILRSVDPQAVPYTFGEVYATDTFYPGALATLGAPYILRDYRGVLVTVNPFQYNPAQRVLRVYTEMTLEVVVDGPGQLNVLSDRPQTVSRAFHEVYARHFLNYETRQRYTPLDETGDMLIIGHDAWLSNVQPLVDHKNSIGISTTPVGVSTIPGGNTSTAIRNYIQDVYDSSDLAFVLLVGDVSQIATPSAVGGASDPTYSLLAGGDSYPDVMVGRFSAESPGDVDTQVERTIEYEQMPGNQQDWFWRGTGIGSSGGPGDDGEYDWQHIDYIRDDLLAYGYTLVDQIYDPGASAAEVSTAVNAGRGIVNYCGHGGITGWTTTGFSNSHVNALVNDNMLPFVCSVACNTGEFDGYTTCFAEAWMRATHGSEPTGAIAIYASSIGQYWDPPMDAQDEFIDMYVSETYNCLGTLFYAGSCHMMDEYPPGHPEGAGVDMFKTWIYFGDPSLRVVGDITPPALNMSLPNGVPETVEPGVATPITVQIEDGEESYVPGSGLLHYRFAEGAPFETFPLTPLGGDLYEALLPAADCDDEPQFYFSATGDGGTTVTLPRNAPDEYYAIQVGVYVAIMDDDFETDQGWTVDDSPLLSDGTWERGVPAGGGERGDPPTDYDGSGQCYLTGNEYGNSDVDDGYTWLISPTIDLTDQDEAEVHYALWYTNNFGADPNNDLFKTYVSGDNGANWTLVETIGPQTSAGWTEHSFLVREFVTPTAQVKVRFEASDLGSGSVVEAGIDAFQVIALQCEDTCFGDLDGDNDVDLDDLATLLAHYGMTSGATYEDGDLDGDGDVDLNDLSDLLAVYGTVCG
jgi:gingipain R